MVKKMELKGKNLTSLFIFLVVWSILSILGVSWGNRVDWPDNVHINYGFPIHWSTNTISTLSGSVNIWTVNIEALISNLGFWLGIMLAISLAIIYLEKISKTN